MDELALYISYGVSQIDVTALLPRRLRNALGRESESHSFPRPSELRERHQCRDYVVARVIQKYDVPRDALSFRSETFY